MDTTLADGSLILWIDITTALWLWIEPLITTPNRLLNKFKHYESLELFTDAFLSGASKPTHKIPRSVT